MSPSTISGMEIFNLPAITETSLMICQTQVVQEHASTSIQLEAIIRKVFRVDMTTGRGTH